VPLVVACPAGREPFCCVYFQQIRGEAADRPLSGCLAPCFAAAPDTDIILHYNVSSAGAVCRLTNSARSGAAAFLGLSSARGQEDRQMGFPNVTALGDRRS
jgi:hypothetical protein